MARGRKKKIEEPEVTFEPVEEIVEQPVEEPVIVVKSKPVEYVVNKGNCIYTRANVAKRQGEVVKADMLNGGQSCFDALIREGFLVVK